MVVSVAGLGKNVGLFGRALNTRTAKAIARHSGQVPNDNNLLKAIEAYAGEFAEKIGISGLKCKALPWIATVKLPQLEQQGRTRSR